MTATGYHCLVQLKEPASGVSPRAAASTMGTRSGVMPMSGFPARASLAISSGAMVVPEEATATRDARSTRGDRVTPTARALGAARPRAKTPRRWASAEVAGDVIANDDMATGGRATGVRSHTGGLEDARRDAERSAGGERSGGLRGSSAGGLPVRAESARPAHGRRRRARSPSHISESAGKCRTVIGRRGCNLEKRMGNSMRKTCGPPLARFLISDPSRSSWSQRCFADGVPL